jgi:hypothetical protein
LSFLVARIRKGFLALAAPISASPPMLSIPLAGIGMPDDDKINLLDGLANWIAPNGEAI